MMNVVKLETGWSFRQTDTAEWHPVARVPTNVHLDLLDNKLISDPFLGFNELQCQWVAEKTWSYKVTLPPIAPSQTGMKHVLAFDGLDTFATARLDGEVVLQSDNMFIMHRVDVSRQLAQQGSHNLEIEFKPALLEARKIREAHPEHRWVGFNGDVSRLAVRKAQYHWGWDWGPELMTCGPWREVRLESYHARVKHMRVDFSVAHDLQSVRGTFQATVEGPGKQVEFAAALDGAEVFNGITDVGNDGKAAVEFIVKQPKLWYPHGYGRQPLYTVTASLLDGPDVLHSLSKRTGFRKLDLVQDPDEVGKSFFFRINGVDVFCGGSDWIPADSFTPRISAARYRKWLQMMVDGYQIMIRIWGGGIWEEDVFYELCDELGILVWQDFMFACGNYPAYPDMLKSIEQESVCQTRRLRHHPCLAVFAGNNEDYQVQESSGLTYDYKDKDPKSWLKTDFPARYIYEKLLPDVVAAQCPHVPYHPGSPWGDGKITSDQTVGDMHQWNVWHGTQEKYQIFDQLGGRFNSEFGMEAFPHIDTIKYFVTDPSQLYPQSHMIDFHNKADGHERRIATYLVENFRTRTELDKFIHLTQLSQAEALMFAYRGWRRQWGQKRLCGGALVWQLNDCWPVTSWAIVDYFQRKKPAYYVMRRALAPVAIAVRREHHDWSVVHARPAKQSKYECWVASSKLEEVTASVELRYISIATGQDIKHRVVLEDVRIAPNGTTELFQGIIDNERDEAHVLSARIWIDQELMSRDCDWPQPLKYLDFSDRGVSVESGNGTMTVKARKPTKGLVFEEREGVLVTDSALDIVPGDEQIIKVKGMDMGSKHLDWTFLGAP